MTITELIIQDNKNTPKEYLQLAIEADKIFWKESFYPYPVPSSQTFEYDLKQEKDHFYYLFSFEEQKMVAVLKAEITITDKNEKDPLNIESIPYIELVVKENKRKNGKAKELVRYFADHFPYNYNLLEFHMRYDREKELDLFLQSIGSKLVYTSRRSASQLQEFDKDQVKEISTKLEKIANNKGFSLLFIKNGEFSLKGISFTDYVLLVEHMKNTSPHEDRKRDPVKLNPEEYIKRYEKTKVLDQASFTWIVVDTNTNKPIAFTESWYHLSHPEIVIQGDTGVLTEFRGNKLGLTLKYKMLDFLLSQEITKKAVYWTTNNAHTNKYMIAINNELKYKENGLFNVYYLSKEKFLNYIKMY